MRTVLAFLSCCVGLSPGKVQLPFSTFLLQQPAFQADTNSLEAPRTVPAIGSVPLVMRILFEEAEQVVNGELLPQGGDFQSLARSIKPRNQQEVGIHRVVLDFPLLSYEDLSAGAEAWLVFQLRKPYMQSNNCTQLLTVYENDQSLKVVITIPVDYSNSEPLLVVNITRSLRQRKQRPSYGVMIKDSTSYTRDEHLYSFSNYIDCSLTRIGEVLELKDPDASPVLLILSPQLAAQNLFEPKKRYRRMVDSSVDFNQEIDMKSEGSEYDLNNSCRLLEWMVNIEQLGWDWLIYPERIPLNLCVGTCPTILDRHFNATSHAVARGLYRLVLGQEAKPENGEPCCVPVKYKRFTMLIEKSPGVISLETSADLSASQCGCR